jgi:tetratricopeptide (TPR) repeat protein
LLKKFRQEGVDHLIIVHQRTRDVGNHYAWRGDELALAAEFLASHTEPVASTDMVEVLRVSRAARPRRLLDGYNWFLFSHPENMLYENREVEARDLLGETLRVAPWLRGTKPYLGVALVRLGRFQEAVTVLAQGAGEGGILGAHSAYLLGQIRRMKHDLPGAARAWRDAIRMNPKHAEAHYNLGLLLHEQGRKREAFAEADAAARLAPANPDFVRVRDDMARALSGRSASGGVKGR